MIVSLSINSSTSEVELSENWDKVSKKGISIEKSSKESVRKLSYNGAILLHVTDPQPKWENLFPLIKTHSCWLNYQGILSDIDKAIELLNGGLLKLILNEEEFSKDKFSQLPSTTDRIILRVNASGLLSDEDKQVKMMDLVMNHFNGIILSFVHSEINLGLVEKFRKGLHPSKFCGVIGGIDNVEKISTIDKMGAHPILCSSLIDGTLDLGTAISAPLVTDRSDGLFATVVVDEQGVALGLVYSSKESISESIKTGKGVYCSRKRGLWYKGETSGATQDLIRIDVDCDRDSLRFVVHQNGAGFCHLETLSCYGEASGMGKLMRVLESRKISAPVGSYTERLFKDPALLRAKILEEAEELCNAETFDEIASEAADVLYFSFVKCVSKGVSIKDIEAKLDQRSLVVKRRAGDAKPGKLEEAQQAVNKKTKIEDSKSNNVSETIQSKSADGKIRMQVYNWNEIDELKKKNLLLRPIIESSDIMNRVKPIMEDIRKRGDAALLEFTEKFDRVKLTSPVIDLPLKQKVQLDPKVAASIDLAMNNVLKFHEAQITQELVVETMPGIVCRRFTRPIERVGLYVPGGSAVLPSTTYMLGIPAKVAGCKEIIIATPPRKDGTICPEVLYVAEKLGAKKVVVAGGAQAVFAMAYGTESVPKVDKICGPGNQYVTAAKMLAQNDSSAMISIDMPAGPSELLVIANEQSNAAYVASDLLSQAEHGPDSQVVLLAVGISEEKLSEIEDQIHQQAIVLPRVDVVKQSIPKSFILRVPTMEHAMDYSNKYAPEHLIINIEDAEKYLGMVENAGSVFLGPYSSESCGDYASGTNHTLPTYGYARMYSGVNTSTFLKHITSQTLTREGLNGIGDAVETLASVEELQAHKNAVTIRLSDIRKGR